MGKGDADLFETPSMLECGGTQCEQHSKRLPLNVRQTRLLQGQRSRGPDSGLTVFLPQHTSDTATRLNSNSRVAVGCVAPDKSAKHSISLALWPVRACFPECERANPTDDNTAFNFHSVSH